LKCLDVPVVAQRDKGSLALLGMTERSFDGSGGIMQMVITFMAVVAGLIFSVAVALLAEEFIFGQVFRLFFVRQTVPVKIGQKR
jgi:hypothetical protein